MIGKNDKGFTIVELLIATAVFSVVILVTSVMIIEISKLYYKGVVTARTQTAARELVDAVSQPIKLESATVQAGKQDTTSIPNYAIKTLCVGDTRFTYVVGLKSGATHGANSDSIFHAVWRDQVASPSACLTLDPPDIDDPNLTGGSDMLGENMRLTAFDVTPSSIDQNLWNINISVIYGQRDLMIPAYNGALPGPQIPSDCNGFVTGSQWCARVTYDTRVYKRIVGS